MPMEYAASIPAHFNESFARDVLNYRKRELDKQLARSLSTIRMVGPTVDKDTITFYEKTGGNDNIAAKITAKGAIPEQIGVKGNEVTHSMYQVTVGFMLNGRDLNLDPAVQRRKVEVATAEVRRREDYTWINGDTATGLTGLVASARANPNGRVVASGATSSDVNNIGTWAGTDTHIDIYTDVLEACNRIGDDFAPKYLCGTRQTLAPIRKMDDLRNVYADQLLDLFGAGSTNDFIRTSKYFPTGYAYVIAQDMEFNEFVISEDLAVDTAFGKEPGNNYRVELREWVAFEFHNNEGAVEINTQ